MKFQYSPGLFGYGPKGADGSIGLDGLSFYFTDYDPTSDILNIQSAIENDEIMLSQVPPGTKLPGGRTYNTGDIFIAVSGDIYKIDADANTFSEDPSGAMTKADFFDQYNDAETDNGFERYSNYYNASTNYLIDNALMSGISNYSVVPRFIYSIYSKEFTRMEYTNTVKNYYNAFTVYSAGATTETDDHKSIAIVNEADNGVFRIGNLNNSGNLRNVDLILDVSSLIHTRTSENRIGVNTATGTILTNDDIGTNLFFYPNFTESPASFTASDTGSSADISWDLSDFTSEPSIMGTLFFEKDETPSGSFALDESNNQPLMLYNLDSSGTVTISGLSSTTYSYHIVISKNGWEKKSAIKEIAIV